MSHKRWPPVSLALGTTYSEHPSPHFLQALGAAFNPSFRPEDITVFAEDSRVSVKDPGIHADCCSRWDELSVENHPASWNVAFEHETCAWMNAKRFYDDGIPARIDWKLSVCPHAVADGLNVHVF